MEKIINKGTNAGGKNTNANGLPFEKITEINEYNILEKDKYHYKIQFNECNKIFYKIKNKQLFNYMTKYNNITIDKTNIAQGCKQPDETYINEQNKILYIIEKKFQQVSGSVSEKIQTAIFKREH